MTLPSGSGHEAGYLDLILQAVVDQLINSIADQNAETCYLTSNPGEVPSQNPGQFCIAVKLRPGKFDDSLLDGGIDLQCNLEAGITVRVYSFVQLDEPLRDTIAWTDPQTGLLPKVTQVLKALAGFTPNDTSGNPMLREPMLPDDLNAPEHPRDVPCVDVGFKFGFDWNIG